MHKLVEAYVDGSSNGKSGGVGGWGSIITLKEGGVVVKTKTLYGFEEPATNNSMELRAIIETMRAINKNTKTPVVIYSDSKYAINSITSWCEKWIKEGSLVGRKNHEAIKEGYSLYSSLKEKINLKIKWVKGHSGIDGNEAVDELAVKARKQKIKSN